MTRHTRTLTVALCLIMATLAPSAQQPPDPFATIGGGIYINGNWVPQGHPDAAPARPPDAQVPTVPGCEAVDIYTQPHLALLCADRHQRLYPVQPVPRPFTLGSIYQHLHTGQQVLIIGHALGLDGHEVVTAQVVAPAAQRGVPVAWVNDGGSGAGLWYPVVGQ